MVGREDLWDVRERSFSKISFLFHLYSEIQMLQQILDMSVWTGSRCFYVAKNVLTLAAGTVQWTASEYDVSHVF